MLSERLKTAGILIPPLCLIIYLGGFFLFALSLLVFVLINYEYFRMAGIKKVGRLYQHVGATTLIPLAYYAYSWPGMVGAVVVAFLTVALLHIQDLETREHQPLASNSFPPVIAGILYTGLIGSLTPIAVTRLADSNALIAWIMIIVILTDTCAYAGGRTFGKNKLCPRISPNKTTEGALCGLLGATLGSLLGYYLLGPEYNLFQLAMYGLLAGLLGELGDLTASIFKRMFEVKDTGTLLPGHGGMLDRVDSLIFAVLVVYFL